MGHQLTRPALAAALILVAGACGGDDEAADPPPVLDNARAAAEAGATDGADATEATGGAEDAGAAGTEPSATVSSVAGIDVDEPPPPDPSEYEGANRVVNLWVGANGEMRAIDVWGRRTFTNGPILLAEDIGFGEASDYFSAPLGYRLAIVGSGAGPDGDELAGLFNAADGEQITTIFTNADDRGEVWAPDLWERDPGDRPGVVGVPEPGLALVHLYPANTFAFDDALTEAIGGDSYYVGDGSGACRTQRIEELGFQRSILGGTQPVELDVPAGRSTITLHPWLSPDECEQPAVLDITADVPADRAELILVYTADGTTLLALQLPIS